MYFISRRKWLQRYVSQNLHMGILYSLGVFWNSARFLLNVERDEFVLSRRTAPSFTNPVFKLGMWHEKGSCIRRSPSLCNAFITQLVSRNVFPEFVIIHTGIVCECNCCHLCRLLGKTAVSGYFSSGHVWFRVRMDWIGRRQGKAGGRKRCASLHFR